MSGVSGDFAGLRDMQARIAGLPGTGARVAQRSAPKVTTDLQATFDARETPYGSAWRDGKRGPVSLFKTGALRASMIFRAIGNTIRCLLTVPYARYQVRFGILPRGGGKMPAQWDKIVADESVAEIFERLNGRRG